VRPTALDPAYRSAALERMRTTTHDILVIGGGVTGAGIALDAATRGLSTALVEQRDLSSGTSSRSSKLLHGGLRYLEQYDFGLVREALRERDLHLTTLAPHLARPVSFLFPLTGAAWERAYIGAGIALYDTLGGARNMPAHRHLTRTGALRLVPALRADALRGAIRYYDAQIDDARHTMEIARTAASYGAAIATSARVTGFLREGERVVGAHVTDLETGETLTVRASQVINATGVWTDELQELVGRGRISVRASKGIHLVVPRDRIIADSGLILRTATSVLFVIPWGRHWIIGTTDTEVGPRPRPPRRVPQPTSTTCSTRSTRCCAIPLTHEDVEGVYAGLRPLLSGESDATSTLSREHAVATTAPGLVTIAGGKYTTYRVMAEDAVDLAARALPGRVPDSVTDRTPLVGAVGYFALNNRRHELAARTGLHVVRIEHLLGRYGSLTEELLAMVADDPSSASRSPARRTTSRSRPSTPPATRVRCTSTTCSRDARASPSRPSTVASPPHPTSHGSWRRCSDGTTSVSPARSPTTRRASRRSASRSCRWTTSAPTRHGSARPTSASLRARDQHPPPPPVSCCARAASCAAGTSSSSRVVAVLSARAVAARSARPGAYERTRCSLSARPPTPSTSVLCSRSVGADPAELEFRRVRVTGVFRPEEEVLQRNRVQRGLQGLDVLTPLDLGDGTTLLVRRGWVPTTMDTPPVTDAPPPPGTRHDHRHPRAQRRAADVRRSRPDDGVLARVFHPDTSRLDRQMTGAPARRAAHGRTARCGCDDAARGTRGAGTRRRQPPVLRRPVASVRAARARCVRVVVALAAPSPGRPRPAEPSARRRRTRRIQAAGSCGGGRRPTRARCAQRTVPRTR
jgi:glycerol-3-phosphate dehydrogenase